MPFFRDLQLLILKHNLLLPRMVFLLQSFGLWEDFWGARLEFGYIMLKVGMSY